MNVLSIPSGFSCGNFSYLANVQQNFDGIGFCYSTGDVFDIRPNSANTGLTMNKK